MRAGYLLLLALPCFGATDAFRGLTGVGIVVENVGKAGGLLGLTDADLLSDAQLKLRLAAMRIIPVDSSLRSEDPFLHITVTITSDGSAAMILVEISQAATLLTRPDSKNFYRVTTWSRGTVQGRPTARAIRDVVKDGIDAFLGDWLEVNPRSAAPVPADTPIK
jgi:hypothetical protein